MICLSNERVRLSLSAENGAVTGLVDRERGIDFTSAAALAFEIDWGSGFNHSFTGFFFKQIKEPDGQKVELQWDVQDGLQLFASVSIKNGSDEIKFTSRLENSSKHCVNVVKYPLIGGLRCISENGEADFLAHPYATGVLVKNPYKVFSEENSGFTKMPYPECFSGASMQFLSFYGEGKGGIYAAALDSEAYPKWLNFYKGKHGLEISHAFGYQSLEPGADVNADYPFILKLLRGDGWYEGAEIYRGWAEKQKWCGKGRLADRADSEKPLWLLEEAGVSTFGINAMHDRSRWIDKYHELIKTKMFHVTGPDWPAGPQDYRNNLCGGFDDWFPVRFSKKNLDAFKRHGDTFAPFEFDFFANLNGADSENLKASQMLFPENKYSLDPYPFTILCPAAEYTRSLHISRDEQLYRETGCNALYYDISANNLLHACTSGEHGHQKGGGGQITRAFHRVFKETRDAVSRLAGEYIPIGTELLNEVFLDALDYYQARAWGQPAATLETGAFRELVRNGDLRIIPMFSYVYHEYGGIRLDGYGKLLSEIGDLFYHSVAKTYLWGGIYELNYEWSPMEEVDGEENPASEHYFNFDPRNYELSEERGRYINQFARLRTGIGNRFLAYGRMKPPLKLELPPLKYEYFMYNCPQGFLEYNDRGAFYEPPVMHSIWEYEKDGKKSIGLFFANTASDDITINISLNDVASGIIPKKAVLYSEFEKDCPEARSLPLSGTAELFLEKKQVYLLEIN